MTTLKPLNPNPRSLSFLCNPYVPLVLGDRDHRGTPEVAAENSLSACQSKRHEVRAGQYDNHMPDVWCKEFRESLVQGDVASVANAEWYVLCAYLHRASGIEQAYVKVTYSCQFE